MYGKYDEKIRAFNEQIIKLEAELKAVEKRSYELDKEWCILRHQPMCDPGYYSVLNKEARYYNKRKYELYDEIHQLNTRMNYFKQLWRESRPKEDPYYYMSDDDIRITINANGFINGSKL